MASEQKKCGDCLFYERIEGQRHPYGGYGFCRRYPPASPPTGDEPFYSPVTTAADGWCGEWTKSGDAASGDAESRSSSGELVSRNSWPDELHVAAKDAGAKCEWFLKASSNKKGNSTAIASVSSRVFRHFFPWKKDFLTREELMSLLQNAKAFDPRCFNWDVLFSGRSNRLQSRLALLLQGVPKNHEESK